MKTDPNRRVIMGVCSSLGQRLNIDPNILRAALVVLFFISRGIVIPLYFIVGLLMSTSVSGRGAAPHDKPFDAKPNDKRWKNQWQQQQSDNERSTWSGPASNPGRADTKQTNASDVKYRTDDCGVSGHQQQRKHRADYSEDDYFKQSENKGDWN